MNEPSNNNNFSPDRREFIKMTGLGMAAMSMSGMALASNLGATSLSDMDQEVLETDILVIGGGFAGVFAALNAKQKGADVIMIDKGYIGKSGLSPFARGFATFDKSSQNLDEFLKTVSKNGGNLANQDYIRNFAELSAECGEKLEEWGVTGKAKFGQALRSQIISNNIRTIERTMVTDLIKQDNRVVGAVGFPMEEDKAVVINAKAVILCTGDGGFKPGGFPCCGQTSDGESMAYRAGAGITGKEFNDCHPTSVTNPSAYYKHSNGDWTGNTFKLEGPASSSTHGISIATAVTYHEEGGPITMGGPPGGGSGGPQGGPPGGSEGGAPMGPPPGAESSDGGAPTGPPPGAEGGAQGGPPGGGMPFGPQYEDSRITIGASAGLSGHKTAGVHPTDDKGYSGVPGLYAAGDALGSMMCGTFYSIGGGSTAGSATQGVVAGIAAAEYANGITKPVLPTEKTEQIITDILAPRALEKGYSPAWVTQMLQNTVIPYYALYIKSEERLKAALTQVEFFRDHFASRLIANDTHELRLAHETRNMLLNAEMKIRASLMRTETRGTHVREDFPEQDDSEWLKWIIISQDKDGTMKLDKEDVPADWIA